MRPALTIMVILAAAAPAHGFAGQRPDRAVVKLAAAQRIARSVFPTACEPTIITSLGYTPPTTWDAATVMPTCQLWMRSSWPSWPWWKFCATIVHEYGHMAGLPHSDDSTSIMYPWRSPIAVCAR